MGAIDIEIGPRPLFERAARGIVPARYWHRRFRRFDEKAREVGTAERGAVVAVRRLGPDRQARARLPAAFLELILVRNRLTAAVRFALGALVPDTAVERRVGR